MNDRTIRFPSRFSIGLVSVRGLGTREDWSEFAQAIGDVVVPVDKEARLDVSPIIVFEPSVFLTIESTALSAFSWVSTRRVTSAAVAYLQHLTELRGLELWETNIDDEALQYVKHFSKLRWLDIGDTLVTDNGLESLQVLSRLEELSLLNDRISDKGLNYLQNLSRMECLDVKNTPLTDDGVVTLCSMSRLKRLRIVNTRITEKGYAELRQALPGCQITYDPPPATGEIL